ncbi:chorismate mutase [Leucobacter albus]|uniref:Chorismate mutase n=1 Tax=Leucobacter albus TaxID=272210 RepID=A0ABW3TKE6_9MICO
MTTRKHATPSLAAIRERIDGIDAELVELIAERQRWVVAAGTHKTDDASVRAPARVEQVIAKVRGLAVEAGASPEVVEHTYRAMISAFINLELAEVTARTRAD